MSIISNWVATPSRLRMLYFYLEDKSGETRDRLVAFAGPRPFQKRNADDDESSSSTVVKPIDEAIQMGLLIEDANKISVSKRVDRKRGAVDVDSAFSELVESLLLKSDSPGFESQRSFAPALSWLLMQSPLAPLSFQGNPRERIKEELDGIDYQLSTEASWQNFCHWARFLGFCTFIGVADRIAVVPDPTNAVSRHLFKIFANEKTMPVGMLVERLAEHCPVLEGGWARNEVEGHSRISARDPFTLSQSTSLALKRLANGGFIKIEIRADAQAFVLDYSDSTERVTHVSKGRGR